jgi:hypothetical protein
VSKKKRNLPRCISKTVARIWPFWKSSDWWWDRTLKSPMVKLGYGYTHTHTHTEYNVKIMLISCLILRYIGVTKEQVTAG